MFWLVGKIRRKKKRKGGGVDVMEWSDVLVFPSGIYPNTAVPREKNEGGGAA